MTFGLYRPAPLRRQTLDFSGSGKVKVDVNDLVKSERVQAQVRAARDIFNRGGFHDLIGKKCRCIFNLEFNQWPIAGHPAWVEVVDVDMPMVCIKSSHGGRQLWVNASIIEQIESC